MSVQLNHTIVWSSDPETSALFLSDILGRPAPRKLGHFEIVELDNDIQLDFSKTEESVQQQHYAFMVSEADFDRVLARIKERGISYWADPMCSNKNSINHNDGGRGFYFPDPDNHLLEVITKPYGAEH